MTLFKTNKYFCGNLLSQVCIKTAFCKCNIEAGQSSIQPGAQPLMKPNWFDCILLLLVYILCADDIIIYSFGIGIDRAIS